MTVKLYDNDAYLTKFKANVISCTPFDSGYKVIFDKTAFFPEEGGQYSDKGTANGCEIFNVQIEDGEIVHYCTDALSGEVCCELDFERRFRNMQNHTGEHIISGIVHNLYGGNNVGFHLGEDEVTCDYDVILTKEQIENIEIFANKAIYKNLYVRGYYPDKKELDVIDYRSKKEIDGDIRLVTIEDIDCCACCAPHVKSTGEVGIIKILRFEKLRSGLRFFISCGLDAFIDYSLKHDEIRNISSILKCKTDECDVTVEKINGSLKQTAREVNFLKTKIFENEISNISKTENDLIIFTDSIDNNTLRNIVNSAKEKTEKIIGAFSGNDTDGYSYIIYSQNADLVALSKTLNTSLSGRGGGKNPMVQGSVLANKSDIENFFNNALYLSLNI
ncbi:MAG: hypothetical protein E7568_03755 [Ruminococcaceae bacterium]|nr:hypothetical protein [Oscillospiraceae bacterium]